VAYQPPAEATEGQRPCARGSWCAGRTVAIVDGERVITAASGPRAFCGWDQDTITACLEDLPGLYLRLSGELGKPAVTGTAVHVPFGPSVPVRLDVDAAMRLTATALAMWEGRVEAVASLSRRDPEAPIHDPATVRDAARTLAKHVNVLLALQGGWQTENCPMPAGRASTAARGITGTCATCGRKISLSTVSGRWYAADGHPAAWAEHDHEPVPGTVVAPAPDLIPADVETGNGDAEIVRMGAGYVGIFVRRDGAAAGLDVLHLHYWCRAVLQDTPARPEELLGVECRACSLLALRRADPPWFASDPGYHSECASCGDLMTEGDYALWTGQLAAYHRARLAAAPVLAERA
jgi:hypothetical protein